MREFKNKTQKELTESKIHTEIKDGVFIIESMDIRIETNLDKQLSDRLVDIAKEVGDIMTRNQCVGLAQIYSDTKHDYRIIVHTQYGTISSCHDISKLNESIERVKEDTLSNRIVTIGTLESRWHIPPSLHIDLYPHLGRLLELSNQDVNKHTLHFIFPCKMLRSKLIHYKIDPIDTGSSLYTMEGYFNNHEEMLKIRKGRREPGIMPSGLTKEEHYARKQLKQERRALRSASETSSYRPSKTEVSSSKTDTIITEYHSSRPYPKDTRERSNKHHQSNDPWSNAKQKLKEELGSTTKPVKHPPNSALADAFKKALNQ